MYLKLKIIALLIILLTMAGCGTNNNSQDSPQTLQNEDTNVKQTKEESLITTEVTISEESTIITTAEPTTAEPTTIEPTTEVTTVSIQNKVTVKVTDKKNIPEDLDAYRFSDYVQFTIQATNNTPSSIRGISGILHIDDIFGKNISSRRLDLTGQTIYSGQTVTYSSYGMEVNSFDNEDTKIYNTDYKDLQFSYEVEQIVYGDGTSESA